MSNNDKPFYNQPAGALAVAIGAGYVARKATANAARALQVSPLAAMVIVAVAVLVVSALAQR